MNRLLMGIAVLGLLMPTDASAASDHGRGHPGFAGKSRVLPHVQVRKVWRQGERVPLFYIVPQFLIAEPRAYMLPPPTVGHRWINLDGDAYLVQVANGTVEDLVVVGPTDDDNHAPLPILTAQR
jgi:Ni/Co efflux regulator RcnB